MLKVIFELKIKHMLLWVNYKMNIGTLSIKKKDGNDIYLCTLSTKHFEIKSFMNDKPYYIFIDAVQLMVKLILLRWYFKQ